MLRPTKWLPLLSGQSSLTIIGLRVKPAANIPFRLFATKNPSLYEVLGVTSSTTADDLKKKYRQEALKWHPDRHQGEEKLRAEKRFKQISEAYQVLSDPDKRAQYDASQRFGGGQRSSAGQQEWQRHWNAHRQQTYYQEFSRDEADQLFRSIFGSGGDLEKMIRMMHEQQQGRGGGFGGASSRRSQTGGNPFQGGFGGTFTQKEMDDFMRDLFTNPQRNRNGGQSRGGPGDFWTNTDFERGPTSSRAGSARQTYGTHQEVRQEMLVDANGNRVIRTTTITRGSDGGVTQMVEEKMLDQYGRVISQTEKQAEKGRNTPRSSEQELHSTPGGILSSILGTLSSWISSVWASLMSRIAKYVVQKVVNAILKNNLKDLQKEMDRLRRK